MNFGRPTSFEQEWTSWFFFVWQALLLSFDCYMSETWLTAHKTLQEHLVMPILIVDENF